jgi:hypothetical protein
LKSRLQTHEAILPERFDLTAADIAQHRIRPRKVHAGQR